MLNNITTDDEITTGRRNVVLHNDGRSVVLIKVAVERTVVFRTSERQMKFLKHIMRKEGIFRAKEIKLSLSDEHVSMNGGNVDRHLIAKNWYGPQEVFYFGDL